MSVWLVLDLERDPTPGDPDGIRALAARLRREAEYAEQHTSRLRQVAANSGNLCMRGDYAPRFSKALKELPGASVRLGPAHQSCANALEEYASRLQQAKLRSAAALERGLRADAQYRTGLQQFYALVPVAPSARGIWRGLNQSTALHYSQYQQPAVRETAVRIGAYAGQAEQERQLAARQAREAAQYLREAEALCVQAIRAATPEPAKEDDGRQRGGASIAAIEDQGTPTVRRKTFDLGPGRQGFSIMSRNDRFYQNVLNIKPLPDHYDIVAHGTTHYTAMDTVEGRAVTAREMANIIRRRPDYHPGMPVRLLSCNTGRTDGVFASQLARNLGVSVIAPDGYLYLDQWGRMGVDRSLNLRFFGNPERLPNSFFRYHPDGHSEELPRSEWYAK